MTTETPPDDWVLLEAAERGGIRHHTIEWLRSAYRNNKPFTALCDMIQQHEAFKQEVSKAMTYTKALYPTLPTDYDRFIIPKSDPLADRKLLCAREAAAQLYSGEREEAEFMRGHRDEYDQVWCGKRAIELWEEGFGK
jgi:hypothetical protein